MTKIDVQNNTIQIYTDYENKDICKSLSSRSWNPAAKCWEAPISILDEAIRKFPGAELSESAQAITKKVSEIKIMATNATGHAVLPVKPGLKLYPFQIAGVEFLNAVDGKGMIADEMGLGKTVQALEYLYIHPEMRPALIVCPASLKINWDREATKWLSEKDTIQVVNGKAITSGSSVYIINYDIIKKHEEALKSLNFQIGVLDESHYIKNYKAIRTIKVQELFSKIPHRVLLTGTPILNRPSELFTQISILQPWMFYSFFKFAERYCNLRKTRFGIDTSGASNIPELNEMLKSFTVRRLKSQVLTELPDKIRTTLELEIDNKAEYKKAEYSIIEYLREKKGDSAANAASYAEMLVEIESLKQLSAKGKIAAVFEWIEDFLESGEKLVIFASHTDIIQSVVTKFPNRSVSLTGSDSPEMRQKAIDQFQNNPEIKLFVGNLQAAGVGITLTASSNVAFIELGWTPSVMSQAEDRCHRIGQKNAVNIYYLLGKSTIDIKIAELLTSKASTIDAIMDGKSAPELNIMANLIEYLQ